ncbi:MAG: SYNERG-CTERM sorting domain-containing protein [Synergistaceae bacterium]|nr:SYNERG-CTERM sorting domain-containing protein [Synergistaceae bacterium]
MSAPSTWSKVRAGTTYGLVIPLTKEFIAHFDANGDGRLTDAELASVMPVVSAPNATLTDYGWDVEGSSLRVDLDFDPKEGHTADWYKGVLLANLTVTGANEEAVRYTFANGVELEDVSNVRTGGGGCDAGGSFLALLLLAPLAFRGKKR